MQSVKLALRLAKETSMHIRPSSIYTLYPGTELYPLAIKMGFRNPSKLEDWASFNYSDVCKHYPWLTKKRIQMLKTWNSHQISQQEHPVQDPQQDGKDGIWFVPSACQIQV